MSRIASAVASYFKLEIMRAELENKVFAACQEFPSERDAILSELEAHDREELRVMATDTRAYFDRIDALVTDLDEVRANSALQPGMRVRLSGGYMHTSDQWWLAGRAYRSGIFLGFYPAQEGRMPVAIIELDELVDLTEHCGRRHFGRIAVVRLLFAGESWGDSVIVMIHIVEQIPQDTVEFCETHRFGCELESHATLEILRSDR